MRSFAVRPLRLCGIPFATVAAWCACCLAAITAAAASPDDKPKKNPHVEQAARDALHSMARAYADLHEIDQETTFDDPGNLTGQGRVRLVAKKPNRILLESWPKSAAQAQPGPSALVQCDGKIVYNYLASQGNYTCALAPKRLSDLSDRATTIEMLAVTGADPFARIDEQVRAAHVEEGETIDGVSTQAVVLGIGSEKQPGEARLYLGVDDHLIRRFAVTSATAPASPSTPSKSSGFSYDNHIVTTTKVSDRQFAWVPPPNSYRASPLPGAVPNGKVAKPPKIRYGLFGPDGKPIKMKSLADMIKDAQK